jgi:hypothetical protein
MIRESTPGDDQGAESRGLQRRGGHLRDDDGADHVDGIGGLQVGNTRAQQLLAMLAQTGRWCTR